MTNAKLTAALLKATKQPHDDERKYVYPENLKREYIPQEIFDFFDRMYDPGISDKDLFSDKQTFSIGDCPGVVGYGGIHAAIPNYFFYRIRGQSYPKQRCSELLSAPNDIMRLYFEKYSISTGFEDVLETRMKAKASGDKATANALKLVVNTT